ncbi:pentatricopeptide repeat-containing protein At1g62680, mitochondrial-like [Vitis riparia]|uniref:pentatricopeptide repeat-containing protein At1g62680, mitochondrial-like n=1 Tax=Vitis riparia TaxID=96939 RepID=UPI00155ACB95|nr:pentatricopeptide repeat-containing protein At1g62680, mitochondrial-like [Vitis riparia]
MKHYSTVLSLSKQMDSLGIPSDVYILAIVINSFFHLSRVDFGFSILGKILKLGHQPYTATFTTLIRGLCVEGKIGEALHLFDKMVGEGFQPNEDRQVTKALNIFSKMIAKDISPNVSTYNSLLYGLCKFSECKHVATLMNEMVDSKIMPNVVIFTTLVDALCKEGMVTIAHDVIDVMIQRGMDPDVVTYTALMDGHCFQCWDCNKLG